MEPSLLEDHHLIVFGPALSGKGYAKKKIEEAYRNRVTVIETGALIRDRMRIDPAFEEKWSNTVKTGGLIPDEIILPMAEKDHRKAHDAGARFFFWDGICRKKCQVDWMKEKGLIAQKRTRFFVLRASLETCKTRHQYALQNPSTRGERIDMDCIEDRFKLHMENETEVLTSVRSAGVIPNIIDANRPLHLVALDILLRARQIMPFA